MGATKKRPTKKRPTKRATKKRPTKKRPAKRASKKALSKKAGASAGGEVRVRMYRVGFGDFFLITVPAADGPQHILVDCGVTRGKTGKGDIATIKAAVRHMAAETGRKLALLIVTHRHQDHIIGFSRCADEFTKFKVDAIWMPYWETEYASKVSAFQADLENVALSVRAAALAAGEDANTAEILGIVENATGMALNEGPGGGTNATSLNLLKSGLGVKPDYYAKGDKPKLPGSLVKAGLKATILGPPPAQDIDFLRLMDLKKGVGQYLAAATGGRKKGKLMPFGPEFVVKASTYPTTAFREWAPRTRGVLPDMTRRYDEALEAAVGAATPEALLTAAKKLDSMLNNQSLVVLFEWQGKTLLFAGDAQGGNWEYWLFGSDTPDRDPTRLALSSEGQSILGSIDFYKVGHHGSTNATPIAAVEAMGHDFAAMCSVEADTFGKVENQSEVPRAQLLTALQKKGALVRSDQIAVKEGGVQVPASDHSRLPTPKRGRFERGSCFIDYLL
jgi:beta-lactamase superfamily II metal-dependent hydrolase